MTQDHLLKIDHEEADDWIVSHAVKVDKFPKAVIASSNTDACVCTLYHFSHRMYSGLNEM